MEFDVKRDHGFWTLPNGFGALKEILHERGMVLLRSGHQRELIPIANELGAVHFHTDSDATGLTRISHQGDYDDIGANERNKLGFTQGELIPHTDRSGSNLPPKYLLFWMEKPAQIGGQSLLVDGHQLFEQLSVHGDPQAVEALMRPKLVIFRNEAGFLESSFFSRIRNSLMLRFRHDHMVYASPDVSKILPQVVEKIKKNAIQFRLNAGEGYIIDNHRWLHGRTQFIGDRLAYRLLVDGAQ